MKTNFCGSARASLLTPYTRASLGYNNHCNFKLVAILDDIFKYQQFQSDMKAPVISVDGSCTGPANTTVICCVNS